MPEADKSHVIGLALAGSASGLAVAVCGFLLGALTLWQAGLAVLLALAIGAFISIPWSRDAAALRARARAIGDGETAPLPQARRTALGGDLARALIESQRRVNRALQGLEDRSVTVERVLDAVPEPLFVVDIRQVVTHTNQAAETLVGPNLTGRTLAEAFRQPELLDGVETVVSGAAPDASVDFEAGAANGRSYRAIIGKLEQIGGAGEAAVMTLHDLTAIRRLEALRADFVANASHELRTPLASLVGFIETLEGPARNDPEAQAKFLGIMRNQAVRMTRLVQDLLSLSRIELDEHAPPGQTDDLAAVLSAIVAQLGPVATARPARLEFQCVTPLPAVSGDPDLLQQVFQNLIENGIKYGKPSGAVTITATATPDGARITITDQGEGIPSEHIPRLTERFYRVDVARSRDMGGTGLGLAIVKHILNRCRGELSITSKPGQGSSFTVWLPPPFAS
jgi:two-component system phosphate regulon sensor histidine kinase PhoR